MMLEFRVARTALAESRALTVAAVLLRSPHERVRARAFG